MASSSAGGGLAPAPPEGASDCRVYDAVISGKRTDEIERLIEEIAQGDDEKRKAAVNKTGEDEAGEKESPLKAAKRLERGDLVCRLLVAGADPSQFFYSFHGKTATALAVCCSYGDVSSVRVLLKKGHDPNQKTVNFWTPVGPYADCTVALIHVFAVYANEEPGHDGRLACLRAVVEEGGADADARTDLAGSTALHYLAIKDARTDLLAGSTALHYLAIKAATPQALGVFSARSSLWGPT